MGSEQLIVQVIFRYTKRKQLTTKGFIMKYGCTFFMGLVLVTSQIAFANEEKPHQPQNTEKQQAPLAEIKIETPALIKCFSNKRAFAYGLIGVAALINSGLNIYTAYDNTFGSNKGVRNRLTTTIVGQVSMAVIMGFVAQLAFNKISKCE